MNIDWPKFSGNKIPVISLANKAGSGDPSRLIPYNIVDLVIIPGAGTPAYSREISSLLSKILNLVSRSTTSEASGPHEMNCEPGLSKGPVTVSYSSQDTNEDALLRDTGTSLDETGPGQTLSGHYLALARNTARIIKSIKAHLTELSLGTDKTGYDKYLITVELREGIPDVRVTRQESSGRQVPIEPKYEFNPFAGLEISGAPGRNISGPESEKIRQDDWKDKKADYEKRLNELQMLIDTSYELKDLFDHSRLPDVIEDGR